LIWLLLGILEAMLALRFGLKLIGANAASPFAVFIYGFTGLFLFPFAGLTGAPAAGGMVRIMVIDRVLLWSYCGPSGASSRN
jgi:hypothetical protein